MHIFKIEHRLVATIGTFEKKKKKKSFTSEIQWGTLYQNESTKLRQQEKKKLKQLEKKANDDVAKIADGISAVKLAPAPVKVILFVEIIYVIVNVNSLFNPINEYLNKEEKREKEAIHHELIVKFVSFYS